MLNDTDGIWKPDEIEAIYGVHHVYSQKKSKDEIEHQKKAETVVKGVLERIDLNKDGVITPEELEAVGLDGLPNFDNLGAEGHHYDVESEFFLHHEEQFHSTPETQTDESYNHPEDLEHFAQHEAIERKEAEREAKFQGISVEEVLKFQEEALAAAAAAESAAAQAAAQAPLGSPNVGVKRQPPPEKQDPTLKYKDAKGDATRKGEWGTGEGGYKAPTEPSDKMRRNLPYKVMLYIETSSMILNTEPEFTHAVQVPSQLGRFLRPVVIVELVHLCYLYRIIYYKQHMAVA
ncbi:hypothetical protein CVT24_005325 [Panaeolus cyanescens]|uniref:EF-hand domain-containing protein n=1 Tax=Panaeolus cyanescens TaxID=181874 RepID=A0A409Y8S8_9AGAR|nr:hypothetical protein CVT24_005325 [Panaeolus cyanescens]